MVCSRPGGFEVGSPYQNPLAEYDRSARDSRTSTLPRNDRTGQRVELLGVHPVADWNSLVRIIDISLIT
jgi:hypothetical protein